MGKTNNWENAFLITYNEIFFSYSPKIMYILPNVHQCQHKCPCWHPLWPLFDLFVSPVGKVTTMDAFYPSQANRLFRAFMS